MTQWINVHWNHSFVNLLLWYKNSGAMHLEQPGLMVGWLADKLWINFKLLKFVIDQIFKLLKSYSIIRAV